MVLLCKFLTSWLFIYFSLLLTYFISIDAPHGPRPLGGMYWLTYEISHAHDGHCFSIVYEEIDFIFNTLAHSWCLIQFIITSRLWLPFHHLLKLVLDFNFWLPSFKPVSGFWCKLFRRVWDCSTVNQASWLSPTTSLTLTNRVTS